jgi:hypothetical protein
MCTCPKRTKVPPFHFQPGPRQDFSLNLFRHNVDDLKFFIFDSATSHGQTYALPITTRSLQAAMLLPVE